MRSSLSCDFCRKSKIKCFNEGTPPCRKCAKSGTVGCVLTRPTPGTPKRDLSNVTRVQKRVATPSQSRRSTTDASITRQPISSKSGSNGSSNTDVARHLEDLSEGIILKALNVFMNKFPELAFVHISNFMEEWRTAKGSKESSALLAVILAVTKGQLAVLQVSWDDSLLSADLYASFAKDILSNVLLESPKIQVVQALLIITLYEWGCRNFHKAWVYCGIAIRIMQALHSSRVAPFALETTSNHKVDAITLAIETRTFWGCFIMDCMINSGTYNPPMLPMSEMQKLKVAPPLSAMEFAFGPDIPVQSRTISHGRGIASTRLLDVTQSFEILVSGFDVWLQVMTFIFNDGRRAPGMCAPPNCPWVPGSPWFTLRSHLEEWRASQHRRLHYPSSHVSAHMALGFSESFVYLNLIYYVSTLMLHREYFPFLPTVDMTPRGPIDHPTLEAPAPPGWWENSALELFGAAENITKLLQEASDCGVPLLTPFAGFCAFSACFMNLFVFRFPLLNLGRSTRAEEHLQITINYLEEFRNVWKLGDGWLKTVENASVLYQRAAANRRRYQGKSRAHFNVLHQSVHEFRVVDRSNEQIQEIENAERSDEPSGAGSPPEESPLDSDEMPGDTPFLNQLLVDVGSTMDQGGAWSYWWPSLEEIDLGPNTGPPVIGPGT